VSETDDHVLQLAARQFGCVSVEQAQACGLDFADVRWRVRAGRLERIGARVLRVVGSPPSWEQSLLAGLLDLGPRSVVSHRAAAALHGFEGFGRGPVEFTVDRPRHGLRAPWTVHTTVTLGGTDRAVVSSFACTSATRTIIDLAGRSNRETLERAIARVDFDFAPWLVIVEVSGRRGHASDAERAKDARRRNELQALGLVVLEFTHDDVRHRPGYVVATLTRHLT
jgi:hypothetical protein